ncbi:MAG: periplasmic flagellar collar protein FlcA [Spirochaetota bacterium]
MPELQDLEQLKADIINLGNEPTVLNRRGQSIPEIHPPSEEQDQELADLLAGFGEEFGAEDEETPAFEDELEPLEGLEEEPPAEAEEPEASPEEELEEFEDIEDLFAEETEEPEEAEAAPEETPEEPGEEEFEELEDLEPEELEDETFEPGVEEFLEEESPEAEEAEEVGAEEEEEEFGEDMFEEEPELPDLSGEDFGEEEAESEEDYSPLPEFGEEEEFALPEFEEEELGEEEFAEPEEAEEIEAEEPEEGEEAEEFAVPEFEEEEFEAEPEAGEEGPEEGLEELELPEEEFEEGEFEIDEFNLGDLGEEFGVLEEEETAPGEEEVQPSGEAEEELAEEAAPLQLSDEEFKALTETLVTLPRNLKLIIEEQIGERGLSGEPLNRLVNALVQRRSPKEIAAIASKITGRRIRIPAQYEKKTGAAFEEEKGSFAYAFRHRILPLIRTVVLTAALLALAVFLSYRIIYRPLYALHLYNLGYEQLEERDYPASENYFQRGLDQTVMKKQFFRYADGFKEQKQWTLAEEKYEQLLTHYPLDKQGTLEYAEMELETLSNYEKSADLLNNYLNEEPQDYEVLLLLGDTYLEWGQEDPAKYKQARMSYALLMEKYGVSDLLLFRMLRYFIRTDNQPEVMKLKNYFQAKPEADIDAEAYTELGGYLIDKDRLSEVQEILFRAKDANDRLPETHYQLARYFKRMDEYGEEEKALRNTLSLMQGVSPLTSARIEMKVDTYRRLGERMYDRDNYLEARANYTRGIELYEDALSRKLLSRKPPLGKLYADLGDIHYYQGGEFDQADSLYSEAERNLYDSREMKYKQGYISYRNGDYSDALTEFRQSAGAFSNNHNLVYAKANTFFYRGSYHNAEGHYSHLLDMLKGRLEQERPLLIEERGDHRALVENLMKTSNNLGVNLYNLHTKTGQTEYYTRAMVQFADSSRYFDRLTRDPETLERTGLSNLGFLNQRNLLFPNENYQLQIYTELPIDMQAMEFGS